MSVLGMWTAGCSPDAASGHGDARGTDSPVDGPARAFRSPRPPVAPVPLIARSGNGAPADGPPVATPDGRPGAVPPGRHMRPFTLEVNGILRPATLEADEARVSDDRVVIGVRVGMMARAYLLSAFGENNLQFPIGRTGIAMIDAQDEAALARHVVNDIVGGQPITVTYCGLQQCARVLTEVNRGAPLDVAVGGWDDGLLLFIDGSRMPQRSDGIPLEDVPFELTTWKEWRDEHPQTDVYVGG